jgi:hypothetical protein
MLGMKHVVASNFAGITLFLRNTKEYNDLNFVAFIMFLLCNCTILPTTVDLLETFLEAILRKPFQLFRPIFVMSVASKNFRPFNAHFVQGNTYKSDGAR